jgi:AcrR family transcriptional regulator
MPPKNCSPSAACGVSIREVTKSAGVDLSLVNYHSGTKHGLFSAVVERRGEIYGSLCASSRDSFL